MIIDTNKIKKLVLNKEISAYSLESETGISRATISNYRKGSADLNNMTLKNAMIIQKYIDEKYNK